MVAGRWLPFLGLHMESMGPGSALSFLSPSLSASFCFTPLPRSPASPCFLSPVLMDAALCCWPQSKTWLWLEFHFAQAGPSLWEKLSERVSKHPSDSQLIFLLRTSRAIRSSNLIICRGWVSAHLTAPCWTQRWWQPCSREVCRNKQALWSCTWAGKCPGCLFLH